MGQEFMGLSEDQEQQIMRLFATKFISRPNPVAVQTSSGIYVPNKERKFNKHLLTDHLRGTETYGHYILGEDSTCKFICFDLDLEAADPKTDKYFRLPMSADNAGVFSDWQPGDPRNHWRSRAQGPARDFLKFKMRMITNKLANSAHELLGLPIAVSYTGNKGMHVYVMTGRIPGAEAREAAKLILDHAGGWFPHKAFYKYVHPDANLLDDPEENNEQFTLEVFPKQAALEPDKPLGNLLRLPLGVNKKSPKDPTFFVDMRSALGEIKPMDPIEALTTNNPWR
jgi:hypothetical protein